MLSLFRTGTGLFRDVFYNLPSRSIDRTQDINFKNLEKGQTITTLVKVKKQKFILIELRKLIHITQPILSRNHLFTYLLYVPIYQAKCIYAILPPINSRDINIFLNRQAQLNIWSYRVKQFCQAWK